METNSNSNKTDRPGVSPAVFGMPTWASIDAILEGLPDELDNKTFTAVKNHMSSLVDLLPCQDCRNHYGEYYAEKASGVTNKKSDIVAYWRNLRKGIAQRVGKPVRSETDLVRFNKFREQRLLLIAISVILGSSIILMVTSIILTKLKNQNQNQKTQQQTQSSPQPTIPNTNTVYAQLKWDK